MRVLVTGSSSHLAAALLPALLADVRIGSVVGIDLRPARFDHPRFTPVVDDIRNPELGTLLPGVEAVIHLAFVTLHGRLGRQRHDRALIRDLNVGGSLNVIRLAAAHGVRRLIHCSSAAVYGTWPDNPPRLTEAAPRRVLHGFAYAEDKNAVEDWLDGFEPAHPALGLVRLRPHVILGPHAQRFLRGLATSPFYPWLPGPPPLTQCVHEDDVVQAVLGALFSDARGAFNLACEDALPLREIKRLRHRWPVPVPLALIRAGLAGAFHLCGWGTETGWLRGVRHTLALDSTRARETLAWRPRHPTIRDCLAAIDRPSG